MTDVQKTFLRDSHLCTKFQNQLEREFTCGDWSHCFYRRSFLSVNWAIFVQSEDHKRSIPPRMMNCANIPCKSAIHLHRGSSTRSKLNNRSWAGSKKKRTKRRCTGCTHSYRRKTNISYTMGGVQFVSTTMPAKQKNH